MEARMARIRVLVADDHQVVRQGIAALLAAQPDIEVVGQAMDGRELIEMVEKLHPDVVLTDIAMPHLNGIEAAAQIRKSFPQVQVAILSMHPASSYVIRALRNGALGYLLKNDDIEQVILAIRTVAQGHRYLSGQVSAQTIDAFLSARAADVTIEERITSREREILQLIAEGNTSGKIAGMLSISARTVETHRANLMTKLGLTSQADLVRFAIQHGFVSPTLD
jgi:DNA-binding NarL/FixJ family response regulator